MNYNFPVPELDMVLIAIFALVSFFLSMVGSLIRILETFQESLKNEPKTPINYFFRIVFNVIAVIGCYTLMVDSFRILFVILGAHINIK